MRNTIVKEICKQAWLYMDCLDTKKKTKKQLTKQNKYPLQFSTLLPSLKSIIIFSTKHPSYSSTEGYHKKKKIKENHQKSYQAI